MLYNRLKIFLSLVILIGLTGCGYSSLYKTDTKTGYSGSYSTGVTDELKQIRIAPIANRIGQIVKNRLLDNLTPRGVSQEPKYELRVSIPKPIVRDQVLEQDTTATRKAARYEAEYSLYRNGEEIVEGASRIEVSYNILKNPYSTLASQKDSERRAAKILADDITLRLAAYFKNPYKIKKKKSDKGKK